MSVSINSTLNPLANLRTEALQSSSKTLANQKVEELNDEASGSTNKTELQLKGLDQLDSIAWLQITDATLESAEQKLSTAADHLPEERQPAEKALEDFAQLAQQAHFQGKPVLNIQSPVLETLTLLSDHPPYFMTSADKAVELFQQKMAEKNEAESEQQVPVDLQEKIDQFLQPESYAVLSDEDLQDQIHESLQIFAEIREQLQASLQALETSGASSPKDDLTRLQAAQQQAVNLFQKEPDAALQTHGHATPDLVLNTFAE